MEFLRQFARLFGWKNRQIETLTEVQHDGYKVRIWRISSSLEEAQAFDHDNFKGVVERICENSLPSRWMTHLCSLPKIACVAIVDSTGNGVSVYPDWH